MKKKATSTNTSSTMKQKKVIELQNPRIPKDDVLSGSYIDNDDMNVEDDVVDSASDVSSDADRPFTDDFLHGSDSDNAAADDEGIYMC